MRQLLFCNEDLGYGQTIDINFFYEENVLHDEMRKAELVGNRKKRIVAQPVILWMHKINLFLLQFKVVMLK